MELKEKDRGKEISPGLIMLNKLSSMLTMINGPIALTMSRQI